MSDLATRLSALFIVDEDGGIVEGIREEIIGALNELVEVAKSALLHMETGSPDAFNCSLAEQIESAIAKAAGDQP